MYEKHVLLEASLSVYIYTHKEIGIDTDVDTDLGIDIDMHAYIHTYVHT